METKKKFLDTEFGALVYLCTLGAAVAVGTTLACCGIITLLRG